MNNSMNAPLSMPQLIDEALIKLKFRGEHPEDLPGVATGFYDLDALTGGLHRRTLTMIGARPSMGKTAFVLNIAKHIAVEEKAPIAIFSLECSANQITQRLMTAAAKVDANRMRTGHFKAEDWSNLETAAEQLRTACLVIDDTYSTFEHIAEKCRALKARTEGLFLVIIEDFQQLAAAECETARQNDQMLLGDKLKGLARELDIAIIVTSQLPNQLEFRRNKRPRLSDLRRGVQGMHSPDTILFLYRDEYYDPESEQRGEVEVIIARQKDGPTGTAELLYKASTNNFFNKVHPSGNWGEPFPSKTGQEDEDENDETPEEFPLEGG